MKKIGLFICLISTLMFLGCAAMPYQPGFAYTDYKLPACSPDDASGLQPGPKTGSATLVNYVGVVALGDASIEAAAKAGGIKHVKTVDVHFRTIASVVSWTTTIVTGD